MNPKTLKQLSDRISSGDFAPSVNDAGARPRAEFLTIEVPYGLTRRLRQLAEDNDCSLDVYVAKLLVLGSGKR